jgi:RNA polymerase sigma-70 factor, ECF subfamily
VRTTEGSAQSTNVAQVAARHGARPDFRSVFEAELSFVWNTLRRFGVADRDLEDVAHEVFVVVNRRFAEYDPARPLRPWLFAIAVRQASDYRRLSRNRHETLETESTDVADTSETAEEMLRRNQERNLARQALLAVPEERRTVIVLHDFEEVAMQDVADALGIPLKTAWSRLRIGRSELIDAARRQRGKGDA